MPSGAKRKYLYQRPESQHWWFKFVIDGEPFRGSTGCVEASEAAKVVEVRRVEARAELQARADAIGHIGASSRQITLSQCLERYHAAKASGWRSPECRQRSAEFLLSLGEGPNMLASAITVADLMTYRARRKKMRNRRGQPIKDNTVNRDIDHLRAALNYAESCGFEVPRIRWSQVRVAKAETHRTRTLSEREESKLMAAIAEDHPDLLGPVRFALLSAARKTAVFTLRWDNVDLEEGRAYIELKGEGDQPIMHEVPLTNAMIDLLNAQPKVAGCPFVFTYECRKGDKRAGLVKGLRYPWSEYGMDKPFKACVAKARLRDFRFHDLRHTSATRLVRGTNNLEAARQLLGHADIKTTQKYANLNADDVRAAMESVSKPVFSVIDGRKAV